MMMIKALPKESWHDQRLMGSVKSGDWELGMAIECRKWVEGMDIGVGMGSNICRQGKCQLSSQHIISFHQESRVYYRPREVNCGENIPGIGNRQGEP